MLGAPGTASLAKLAKLVLRVEETTFPVYPDSDRAALRIVLQDSLSRVGSWTTNGIAGHR